MISLSHLLRDAAARFPERPALLPAGGAPVAYGELERRAAVVAGLLRAAGVRPGDAVGLLLPNSPAFVAAYHGAVRAGAVVVPLNVLLAPREIEARLRDSDAVIVATTPELAPAAGEAATLLLDPLVAPAGEPDAEIAPRGDDEVAVLLYTSGTTGAPRAAELTHGGLAWVAARTADTVLRLTPDDVLWGSLPLAHVFGQTAGMNAAICAGATLVLVPRFEPEAALALMAATRTTGFLAVPTMVIALLAAAGAGGPLPPLRFAHVGGAPLAEETRRAFGERFGCRVLEGLGLTEASGIAVAIHDGRPAPPGSVGEPVGGTEVRIVRLDGADAPPGEPGEVLLRGPGLMRGYRGPERGVDAEGWLATGDVGRLDEDGFLFLVDRTKDTILRGGYTVYPREVEDALYEHPDVLEVAVVGVPDDRLGEEVAALVVPRPGAARDADALTAHARERVAAYKAPRIVVFVDELPKSPTGKILKRAIDVGLLLEAAR